MITNSTFVYCKKLSFGFDEFRRKSINPLVLSIDMVLAAATTNCTIAALFLSDTNVVLKLKNFIRSLKTRLGSNVVLFT